MIHFEQTLYYWNVPGHDDYAGFFENHREGGFFNNFSDTNPIFVFTGVQDIPFDATGIDLSQIEEIDFYLYEPSTYYNINEEKKSCYFYHEDLWEENRNLRSHELDTLAALSEKFGTKINVFASDYNINKYYKETYPNLTLATFDTFLRQIGNGGIYPDDLLKTKKFVSHNKRFAMHRLVTVSALQDKNANYTWPFVMDCDLKSTAWYEHENLPQVHDKIVTPRLIDVQTPMHIADLTHAGRAPYVAEFCPGDLVTSMSEACIAVVNETRFGQPTAYFSEKTFDAMRCMIPFIIVAPPYTLEYLRQFKFYTWGAFWDERYDKIENHTKRIDAIIKLIEHLDTWTIDDMREVIRQAEWGINRNLQQVNQFISNSTILYQ